MRDQYVHPGYWCLVAERAGRIVRTPFQYGRIHPTLVCAARMHGWTPLAFVKHRSIDRNEVPRDKTPLVNLD